MKKTNWGSIGLFASYSYTDARYGNFSVVKKEGNTLVESNLKTTGWKMHRSMFSGRVHLLFQGILHHTPDQPYQSYVQRCQ